MRSHPIPPHRSVAQRRVIANLPSFDGNVDTRVAFPRAFFPRAKAQHSRDPCCSTDRRPPGGLPQFGYWSPKIKRESEFQRGEIASRPRKETRLLPSEVQRSPGSLASPAAAPGRVAGPRPGAYVSIYGLGPLLKGTSAAL